MGNITPMMRHYLLLKEKYNDCILFYRLGDFYEMFFEDAVTASRVLELTLTGRDCGLEERAPMCGVPYHSVNGYINKLVEKGYKVALCEQLSDPAQSVGLVERDVVRIITAGTVIEESMLEETKNNFLMSIFKQDENYAIAWADISTGEFFAASFESGKSLASLNDYIATIKPAEIIVNNDMYINSDTLACKRFPVPPVLSCIKDEYFSYEACRNTLSEHFGAGYIESIQPELSQLAVCAAGALLKHLYDTQKNKMQHITQITVENLTKYMQIDITTRRNLELTEPIRGKGKKGTLLWLLDKTKTAMG
ncbi:MAG TPA: DNA mismatch repair protein MutS, partial [Clostridia bacterium]|nr:DNA mismatch repair protein MutS [Clostridia bacterium]